MRNFTDVDDKIIARGAALGEDPLALAQRFIGEFHADMVRPPGLCFKGCVLGAPLRAASTACV